MRRYALLVALLAVAGCAQERAGSLPNAAPVTTTTSLAPAPTAATADAEIQAAVRTYYAALHRAGADGDVAPLRALIDPACDCVQQVSALEAEVRAGRRVTTEYVVDAVATHDLTAAQGWATVTLTYAASRVVDGQGRVVRTIPGKTRAGRDLLFRKEGTTWRLTRLVLLG